MAKVSDGNAFLRSSEDAEVRFNDIIGEVAERLLSEHDIPEPMEDTLRGWDELVDEWIASGDTPIVVRGVTWPRGSFQEIGGRRVLSVDNTPAQWAYSLAAQNIVPTLDEIRAGWESRSLS